MGRGRAVWSGRNFLYIYKVGGWVRGGHVHCKCSCAHHPSHSLISRAIACAHGVPPEEEAYEEHSEQDEEGLGAFLVERTFECLELMEGRKGWWGG
eukprot:scaffold55447_cov28-Tisochrysis_lutea.AAC.4